MLALASVWSPPERATLPKSLVAVRNKLKLSGINFDHHDALISSSQFRSLFVLLARRWSYCLFRNSFWHLLFRRPPLAGGAVVAQLFLRVPVFAYSRVCCPYSNLCVRQAPRSEVARHLLFPATKGCRPANFSLNLAHYGSCARRRTGRRV